MNIVWEKKRKRNYIVVFEQVKAWEKFKARNAFTHRAFLRIDLFRVSLKSEDKNEHVIDVGFPDTGILLAVHNF